MAQPHFRILPASLRIPDTERRQRAGAPGFGRIFTEHMVSLRWSPGRGWHSGEVRQFQDLSMSPASVGLHYGQVVFEGLKAHWWAPDAAAIFRPWAHARRFRASARRLSMPELADDHFVEAVTELVRVDLDWVPDLPDQSLYLRPVLFGSEATLAVRPSREYQFIVVACVVESFFDGAGRPLRVWVSEDTARATPGGTGQAKCAGNYAPTFPVQAEAARHGCDQVIWLDAGGQRRIEELGAMNVFLVRGGDRPALVTPPLTGTLLPGVTRDSLLTLAESLGIQAREEDVTVEQWRQECDSGRVTEAFAAGTAARVVPIGEVCSRQGGWRTGGDTAGPVTSRLSDALFAVQAGAAPDRHGWMHPVTRSPGQQPSSTATPSLSAVPVPASPVPGAEP